MLNPSKAGATKNDPTIGRCMALARAWGYGQLRVVNLFVLIATKPKDLATKLVNHKDIIGPGNDDVIRETVSKANLVVCP